MWHPAATRAVDGEMPEHYKTFQRRRCFAEGALRAGAPG